MLELEALYLEKEKNNYYEKVYYFGKDLSIYESLESLSKIKKTL